MYFNYYRKQHCLFRLHIASHDELKEMVKRAHVLARIIDKKMME